MIANNHSPRIVGGLVGLEKARASLEAGELVAFSTETVYGLGADATNDQAVTQIFKAKGRPHFNPLIVHIASVEKAKYIVSWSDAASQLAKSFWPGALTLVLPRLPNCRVSLLASAGLDSLAVRVPGHELARKLLKIVNCPVAAPSANKSGYISPTTAVHVDGEFGPELAIILDGGPCQVGLESSVVDLTTNQPTLLRPGGITKEKLETVIGPLVIATKGSEKKSPGMFERHYAPSAALRLNAETPVDGEVLLGFGPSAPEGALNLSPSGDVVEAATRLFLTLRKLDSEGVKNLAVMPIPETGLGLAINDRLRRAAKQD